MKRWFWTLDAVVVVLFAVVGREDHGFTSDMGDYIRVSAPFLIGLAITIVLVRAWRDPSYWLTGLFLGIGTTFFGMILRALVWDNGTARTFIVVASAWMIGMMVLWRLVALGVSRIARRRNAAAA